MRPSATADAAGAKTLAVYSDRTAAQAPSAPKESAPAPGAAAPLRTAAQPETKDAAPPASRPAPRALAKNPAPLAGFVDPLTKSGERVPITLDACIRRTLANNLGVQIARYGPPIARTSVRETEAIFDPTWFLNNALGRIKEEAGSFLAGAANTLVARQRQFSTGVQSLLPTGGTWQLSQDWTWLRTNSLFFTPNPQYDSNLTLSVQQSLLRGAGVEVTRSPIVLARLDYDISAADFKARLMDIVLEVEQAYWDLVVAQTQVQSVTEALQAAQENLRIARRRFEEGADKRVVVSLAEAAATSRQADLVSARLQLVQTSDRLKRLINDPELPLTDPAVLAAQELPAAEPAPVLLPMLHQSMAAAMQNRPEIRQAEDRVAQAGVNERVARNQKLPQLDLGASFNLNGLSYDLDRSLDKEFQTRWYDWSVRVDFSVPIGNRARRAAHERSKLLEHQSTRSREDVRQQVLLDVSDAVRNLAAAEESVRARRAARLAAEQVVRDEQAFVSAGAALLKDLLDAQRDLAAAKVSEMQAMTAYMVGLAALERAKGTLLDFNDIRLVDEPSGPQAVMGR